MDQAAIQSAIDHFEARSRLFKDPFGATALECMHRVLAVALLRSDAQGERGGWRPIVSAPKDALVDIWIINSDGAGLRWSDCYYDAICDEWRTSRPSGHLLSIKSKRVHYWRQPPSAPGAAPSTPSPSDWEAGAREMQESCAKLFDDRAKSIAYCSSGIDERDSAKTIRALPIPRRP